ncbi:signal transduction histidine kinase [Polymorphobacter glacialis]|uniref:histidine kinase n=1 Tax=Sandarakinorhabdus glacialis TaxID=1614636 RepID=A0A916ZW41_9SPHN|nr:PAS domain-containing protein [Polymorphobacter glacialis]GGE14346.1 signal transduction histidine kinase [Polymorphobacter glacialis]
MAEIREQAAGVDAGFPAAASAQGLADRAKLALIAVDRTHMPMMVSDPQQPDAPIILANQAFLDLTGYSADEVIGRNCRFLQGPGTDPADVAVIRDAVAAGENVIWQLKNYRKDGSAFWNQLHISPIRDDGGVMRYYFASQLDVTDARRARELEQAEHALLKEVDHRAQNALALVQGIVRLTRNDDARDYARMVMGRVEALADAHSMLADHRWLQVPLSMLIRRRLTPWTARQVRLSGSEVTIDPAQAQPLALLLHELMGNVVAHGALSVPQGGLDVTWQRDEKATTIRFAETGGPKPVLPAQKGVGIRLMEAIAVRQLRGSLEMDWRPEGLTVCLAVPAIA